jgi:cyclopropane fatty-acyl-phospholipid synthase-like methyltransferase
MDNRNDYVWRWQSKRYVDDYLYFTEGLEADAAEWVKRLSVTASSVVVDLGCGEGKLLTSLAAHIGQGLGIDASPHMARRATERATDQGHRNVQIVLGDFRRLCLRSGSVDAVVSCGAIYHVPDGDKRWMFSQIASALRAGGVFHVKDDSFNFPAAELEQRTAQIYEDWRGSFGDAPWAWMKDNLAGDDFECTPFLEDLKEMISSAGFRFTDEIRHGLDGVDLTAVKE